MSITAPILFDHKRPTVVVRPGGNLITMPAGSRGCFLPSEVTKENASARNRKLCVGFILAGRFDVAGDVFAVSIKAGHFREDSQPVTSRVLYDTSQGQRQSEARLFLYYFHNCTF
jgi:hypothetical protein